jgi:cytochrome c
VLGNTIDEMHDMNLSATKGILVLVSIFASSSRTMAAGDAAAGQSVFASRCAVCHATEAGQNKVGPSLAGIVGSKSGTVPGFDFSPAMKNADITWNDAELDKFLANPSGTFTGQKCSSIFPAKAIDRT